MDLYDWILRGLEQKGKTRIGLARALGLEPSAITQMLSPKNGKRRRIQAKEIQPIADYLGVMPPTPTISAPDPSAVAASQQSFRIYHLEDSDRIQVEIGDLERGFLRALHRVGTPAKEARAIVGVLIEALAELPSAHAFRRLAVPDRKPAGLIEQELGDQ